jgi:hypothetical protein
MPGQSRLGIGVERGATGGLGPGHRGACHGALLGDLLQRLQREVVRIVHGEDLLGLAVLLQAVLDGRDLPFQGADLVDQELARLVGRRVARLDVELDVRVGHAVGHIRRQLRLRVDPGDAHEVGVAHRRNLERAHDLRGGEIQRILLHALAALAGQHGLDPGQQAGLPLLDREVGMGRQVETLGGRARDRRARDDLVLGLIEVVVGRPGIVRAGHVLKVEDLRVQTLDLQGGRGPVERRGQERAHQGREPQRHDREIHHPAPAHEDLPIAEQVDALDGGAPFHGLRIHVQPIKKE